MRHRTPLLTAALAAAAVAAPAASAASLPMPGDAAFAVPSGKVEHTVTTYDVTGRNAVESHERQELWLGRSTGRLTIRDATSGKLLREVTYRQGTTRVYDAKTKTLEVILDRSPANPWNSFRFEAAVQKAYVDQGYVKVVGETTVGGRRALITESQRPKWRSDDTTTTTRAVVDASDFTLYERTTSRADGAFAQKEVHEVNEVLDASAPEVTARMAMARHKPAKIVRRTKP